MNNFIYCFDEILKNKLTNQGCEEINKTIYANKDCWILSAKNTKLQFNKEDKSKYILTNKLIF